MSLEITPACILFLFGWIGVFFTFEPEVKPVYCSALGNHAILWPYDDMPRIWHEDHFYWLAQPAKSHVPFPKHQERNA